MKWIRNLFGFKTKLERKQEKLAQAREKGFQAQRNGNLSLAGKFYHEAEILETEIEEMLEEANESL